jgi:hypothetical protein
VAAGELYIGDKLLDAQGNELVLEDTRFETTETPVKVYNFKVEDFHTYHVGSIGVFVHNANCAPRRPRKDVVDEVHHADGTVTYTKIIDGEAISVTYSKDGYPDFSNYTHPDYSDPVAINVTGNNNADFAAANKAIGLEGNRPPDGYTWHHVEDGQHMILVRRDVHDATIGGFPHTGGASIVRNN